MRRVLSLLLLVPLIFGCEGAPSAGVGTDTLPAPAAQSSSSPRLYFPNHPEAPPLELELAQTSSERARGLSGRIVLAPQAGMLFIFSSDTQGGFWMKDTLIPLDIAFISAQGEVVGIDSMVPHDLTPHASALPYRYALEVNSDILEQYGIKVGEPVLFEGLPQY